MKRTLTIHTAVLIALPFMLLPAAYWLAGNALVPASPGTWLQSVIWSLRVIYVGGAFVGWRAGRPHWVLSLAGFRVVRGGRLSAPIRLSHRSLGNRWLLAIPGFRPYPLGILPLLRDSTPGWLAQVPQAVGGIHGLSPRRTDHSTI